MAWLDKSIDNSVCLMELVVLHQFSVCLWGSRQTETPRDHNQGQRVRDVSLWHPAQDPPAVSQHTIQHWSVWTETTFIEFNHNVNTQSRYWREHVCLRSNKSSHIHLTRDRIQLYNFHLVQLHSMHRKREDNSTWVIHYPNLKGDIFAIFGPIWRVNSWYTPFI